MADSAMCWSGVAAPAKAIVRLTFPNHGHSRKSRSCCFNEFRDTLKGDATEGTFNPQKGTCPESITFDHALALHTFTTMAPSVLGKRQRSAADPHGTTLRSPRKRRFAQHEPEIHHDSESDDPFSLPIRQRRSKRLQTCSPQDETQAKRPKISEQPNCTASSKPLPKSSQAKKTKELVTDENADPSRQFATPQSRRFRDALSTVTPVTPKHRVQVAIKPVTPRTPRPIPSVSARTVYTDARQLFVRSANPGRLVGRQAERDELTRFIQNAVSSKRGGCMYVSGPPGTGKSALVEEVCRELQPRITAKAAYVNCASMTSARDIYRKLVEDLCGESQVFKKSEAERLRGMFLPKKKSCSDIFLVALDEIDHLLTGDQEILYNFFEWSLQTNSRLVLIGIANALDLTDRFLPRLKAKNLKPQLLPFLPYTPAQITNSLLLDDAAVAKGFVPFLHPAAIQFCARKVASQSGDLRKAFDLVRRTIELIEREPKQKFDGVPAISSKPPLLENMNLASPLSPPDTPEPVSRYTAATAPRATVAHVARVTSAAFGHGTTERLQGLNLHQKATLCALISAGRKRRATFNGSNTPTKSPRSTAPTVKELFDTYSSLCRRDNVLQPLSITEFKDIIGSLETMGLVGEAQTRGGRGGAAMASGSVMLRTPTRTGRGITGSPSKMGVDASGPDLLCW
ncbi:cell division control protein 6 [Coccidioides immitis H538.4]|uniref:Cell division control protein 6 n=1 Tax=Coccidioides immitis H538.4 TaxID=396776 RepID=A0A0J8UUI0_COCIT|nr:cell division control protein 6 [Coccidioides immitis H538.4]